LPESKKVVLFAVDTGDGRYTAEDSITELKSLAWTMGWETVGTLIQKRPSPALQTYLGEGKVEELRELITSLGAEAAICDDELTPVQAYHLEEQLQSDVLDRTQLILDIFAERARSKEGKVQVEMARWRYLLPRLTGKGVEMSRIGGMAAAEGATRGPGETKLERERSRIRRRMAVLRRELHKVSERRALHREARNAGDMCTAALVGYTNAGKSSLMNRLCGAEVAVEDKLFATLDPTIRMMTLPQGDMAYLVDTVGFINKLPHDLVAAFRATLEEVNHADILIHVVDASHPLMLEQAATVDQVLAEIGAGDKPVIMALNKADLIPAKSYMDAAKARWPKACIISALTGEGCSDLLWMISETLPRQHVVRTYLVPYTEGQVVAWLHQNGRVLDESYEADAVKIRVELNRRMALMVEGYEMAAERV